MGMFDAEVRSMLFQVLTSWQVLIITILLILYISLVSYAARTRRSSGKSPGTKRKKKSAKAKSDSAPEIVMDDSGLGLEDATDKKS